MPIISYSIVCNYINLKALKTLRGTKCCVLRVACCDILLTYYPYNYTASRGLGLFYN